MFGLKFIRSKEWQQLKEEVTQYKRDLEDIGWINLSNDMMEGAAGMFKGQFKNMLKLMKIYYTKNPLAGLWVNLTTSFVFGEGISKPKCKDARVQEIVDQFWDDPDNQKCLTSFKAQQLLSNKIQYEGNLFFVLFDDEEGNVKVRIFNSEEIDDIINDPEDRMRPQFYKIMMAKKEYDYASESYKIGTKEANYYPCYDMMDPGAFGISIARLRNEARIMHFKTNCDINDSFGIPELYRGSDWIRAHKEMSEDLATLVKALSQFAWKKKIKGGAGKVQTIAEALRSNLNLSNIKQSAGQMQIENEGMDLQSVDVKTGGVKIGTDTSRQMKLMVCAASGIFEHYYGDPSTGNLATAKTMELPMVKKFTTYQKFWNDVYVAIFTYLIHKKIEVGLFPGTFVDDKKINRRVYETDVDLSMDIDFPPVVEQDLESWAKALDQGKKAGLIGEELAAELFLLAANVNNIDEEIEKLRPEWEEKREMEKMTMNNGGFGGNGGGNGNGRGIFKAKEALREDAKTKTLPERMKMRNIRKENYVMQKMNGYRKSIAGHYRKMISNIRENLKVHKVGNEYHGNVINFHKFLNEFIKGMKESAERYYPVAIDIGEQFMKANLKDMRSNLKLNETLYEATKRGKDLLRKRLHWNESFLDGSLEPDMMEAFKETVNKGYETEADFKLAIYGAMSKFDSRLELYSGAFWTVEQEAVKEAGRGTGVMVNFVGPDDSHNCEGCEEAVNGGPYPIGDAPLPGEQECLGRCRHALQIVAESEVTENLIKESKETDSFTMDCTYLDHKSTCSCGGLHEQN